MSNHTIHHTGDPVQERETARDACARRLTAARYSEARFPTQTGRWEIAHLTRTLALYDQEGKA